MMRAAILLALGFAATSSLAEIEKIATPGDQGFKLTWWPKVSVPKGWKHDRRQSLSYGINAMAPETSTFRDAESVMYAKAVYKPRKPDVKSLGDLIADDRKNFTAHDPGLSVREVDPVKTADGQPLRVFAFEPGEKGKGNWERVAYGEEGDFYLVFVMSSRSKTGAERALGDFEKILRSYKEKP